MIINVNVLKRTLVLKIEFSIIVFPLVTTPSSLRAGIIRLFVQEKSSTRIIATINMYQYKYL